MLVCCPLSCIINFPLDASRCFCVFTIKHLSVIKTSFDKCPGDDNSYLIFQIFNPLNSWRNSQHKSIHKDSVKVTWLEHLWSYQLFALISQLLLQHVDKRQGIIADISPTTEKKLFALKITTWKMGPPRQKRDIKYL